MEILLLSGGVSVEREVSLRSGDCVCEALIAKGHDVTSVRVATELPDAQLLAQARAADAVFLCLHGGAGEDGRWQAAMEAAGVFHYTGSGPEASAIAMDKPRAKARVAQIGVPTALGCVWKKGEKHPSIPFPFVTKPCCGGSSVGLCIVNGADELKDFWPVEDLLCECYLPGREYSVAVWNGRVIPPIEIRPRGGVYDYAHKYEAGATQEICPAPIEAARLAQLQDLALICFSSLGLRDYARIDFKEDANGTPCFLEANTLPGMTKTSLFPLAARVAGIPMQELCEKMVQIASARKV